VVHVVGPSVDRTIALQMQRAYNKSQLSKNKIKNAIISSEKNDSKFNNTSKHLLSPKIMKSLPRNLTYHQIKCFSTIPIAFALISLKYSIVILLNLVDKIIQYSITLAK
jgi:hypothetical protein